ncbi:hypothetical protein NQ176_g5000 [Zarea fungicola]|uniref:Uncharacterized protein n=1 Tax=Zarea fungicola TaxID=93591 RepID=A0ACC1NBR0_9HYPO|nr:hypothetical protein NQ176_g5000 [Lecanicillium fungicola]
MNLFNYFPVVSLAAASPLIPAHVTTIEKRVDPPSSRYPRLADGQKYGFGATKLLITGIRILQGSDGDGPQDANIATQFAQGFADRLRSFGTVALLRPGEATEINVQAPNAIYLAASARPADNRNFPLGLLADPNINSQLIAIVGAYFALIEGIKKEVEFTLTILNEQGQNQGAAIFDMELIEKVGGCVGRIRKMSNPDY